MANLLRKGQLFRIGFWFGLGIVVAYDLMEFVGAFILALISR